MSKLNFVTRLKTINGIKTQTIRDSLGPGSYNNVKEGTVKLFTSLNEWYTNFIGLREVKLYQQRVVDLQEKLLNVQEKRRDIGNELQSIRLESNKLQDQIHKIKRSEDLQRYLDLMTAEAKMLQKEEFISNQFSQCDREEREIFTAFTNAVRDSHEKQRAQLEYTKYFGLILSLFGSFLTFCYSTLKKHDLKNFIEDNMIINLKSSGPLLLQLEKNHQDMNRVLNYVDSNKNIVNVIDRNQKELINTLQKVVENNLTMMNTQQHTLVPTLQEYERTKKAVIVLGCTLATIVLFRFLAGS